MSVEERHATSDRLVNPNATRDHLANERTLLAWIRSCIAIAALGFVVARFGLVIRELGPRAPLQTPSGLSTGFGLALVVWGGVLALLATRRYFEIVRSIDTNSYRTSPGLILLLCGGFAAVTVLLAAYLLVTA